MPTHRRVDTVQVCEEQRPAQYPGLIALVSADTRTDKSGPQAAEVAIEYHLGQMSVAPPAAPSSADGIPSDLYQRLLSTLLPTGCFDTQLTLTSHFVEDSPWAIVFQTRPRLKTD